jgi:DNA-binding response OmpR family regulator
MPGMPGHLLAARVRESWADLPVLFVSGDPQCRTLPTQLGGPSRFLSKPFLPSELLEAVQAVLEPASQADLLTDQPVMEMGP